MNNHKLSQLQEYLIKSDYDCYIQPVADPWGGEYVPAAYQRINWLCGFTGSAGLIAVTGKHACLFVDGRYDLQAADELSGQGISIGKLQISAIKKYLQTTLPAGASICFDGELFSQEFITHTMLENSAESFIWHSLPYNPIDTIWANERPELPSSQAFHYQLCYSGKSSSDKLIDIKKHLEMNHHLLAQQAPLLLLTRPDAICWLLNIRGDDVPYTPFLLAFATIDFSNHHISIYVENLAARKHSTISAIEESLAEPPKSPHQWSYQLHEREELINHLQDIIKTDNQLHTICYDKSQISTNIAELISNNSHNIDMPCPVQYLKAQKNTIEADNITKAHIYDGIALTIIIGWLKNYPNSVAASDNSKLRLSEYDIGKKMQEVRQAVAAFFTKDSDANEISYLSMSFAPIVGWAENGAIVHYHAKEGECKLIFDENGKLSQELGLLLMDSGGQYLEGTTDVTRTIFLHNNSWDKDNIKYKNKLEEFRKNYTLVLKGHIALAQAVFPEKTNGTQLDILARQYLWRNSMDYAHGTGHGVGACLSVHESPGRISPRYDKHAGEIHPAMVISNEPGYYQAGEYGIRIENLIISNYYDSDDGKNNYLKFTNLTLAPYEKELINHNMLNADECEYISNYYKKLDEQIIKKIKIIYNEQRFICGINLEEIISWLENELQLQEN